MVTASPSALLGGPSARGRDWAITSSGHHHLDHTVTSTFAAGLPARLPAPFASAYTFTAGRAEGTRPGIRLLAPGPRRTHHARRTADDVVALTHLWRTGRPTTPTAPTGGQLRGSASGCSTPPPSSSAPTARRSGRARPRPAEPRHRHACPGWFARPRARHAPSLPRMKQLLRFAWVEAQCCLFAVLFFLGLALVRVVPLPVDPADALLIWCLGVTLVLWLVRWETGREVAVIFGFHLVGLALELFKVRQGSWSYPDIGHASIGGVPLYSGFMYAAVGSYVCQAWRRFHLRITGYRPRATAARRRARLPELLHVPRDRDVRLPLALALLFVTRRTWVHFTVGRRRYAMPLALSFVLIGFFLWVAENAATLPAGLAVPVAGVGVDARPRRQARVVVAARRRQHRAGRGDQGARGAAVRHSAATSPSCGRPAAVAARRTDVAGGPGPAAATSGWQAPDRAGPVTRRRSHATRGRRAREGTADGSGALRPFRNPRRARSPRSQIPRTAVHSLASQEPRAPQPVPRPVGTSHDEWSHPSPQCADRPAGRHQPGHGGGGSQPRPRGDAAARSRALLGTVRKRARS